MEDFEYCKLEIFIPESHLSVLQKALQSVDAGHIGSYDSCLSYSRVTGCWRPLAGTHPYIGMENEICTAPELKVEVTCRSGQLDRTMAAVKAVHPYEEPVINVIRYIVWACDAAAKSRGVKGRQTGEMNMDRLTEKQKDGYSLPAELQARALMRLGRWEDMAEQLEKEQTDISAQLESLRRAGKEKSVRFRELFARKLTVSTMLDTLRRSEGT